MDYKAFWNGFFVEKAFVKLDSDVYDDVELEFDHPVPDMVEKIGLYGGMSSGERIGLYIDKQDNWFEIQFRRGYLDVYLLGTDEVSSTYNDFSTFGELRKTIKQLIISLSTKKNS